MSGCWYTSDEPLPSLEWAAWCLLTKAMVVPSVATETEPCCVKMTRGVRWERREEPSRDVPVVGEGYECKSS